MPDIFAHTASTNLRAALNMYRVDISSAANSVLEEYTLCCARDNGENCSLRLLNFFDEKISYLETTPLIRCVTLKYVSSIYHVLNFWSHLWLVF